MKDSTKQRHSDAFPSNEISPLPFQALSTLGEPDPANITKQDILSAVAFDKQGEMLAVGDRGGRIIVFQRIEENRVVDFDYLTEFQSHEPAFDPLNSNQIPEKINAIEWTNMFPSSKPQMLTANDKLIKLWRVEMKKEKKYESSKKLLAKGQLMIPRSKVVNESWEGKQKQYYRNGHEYHINSLCVSPDGENFLSADDLRINLWNLEDSSVVYNLLDIKPKNKDELDEVVTHCEFHPLNSALFLYTTSNGFLHICDLRETSTFQGYSSLKVEVGYGQKKNAFSEILNQLSSGKFFKKFPYNVVTRDYLSLKIWDIRSTQSKQPIQNYQVSDYLEKNLLSLYEEDNIYDKFFIDISKDNQYIVTGSYNSSGHVIDVAGTYNHSLPTLFNMPRGKTCGTQKKYGANKKIPPGEGNVDFKKKVQIGCWSPIENTLALVYRNCIFLYSDKVVK